MQILTHSPQSQTCKIKVSGDEVLWRVLFQAPQGNVMHTQVWNTTACPVYTGAGPVLSCRLTDKLCIYFQNISSHLSPGLPFVCTSLGTFYDLKIYSTLLWCGLIPQPILNPYIGYNTTEYGCLRPVLGSYFICYFCSFSLSHLFSLR